MDELVAGADAVAREAISELCRTVLGTPPALATFGTLQALGPLRVLLAPFPTPFEVLYRYGPPPHHQFAKHLNTSIDALHSCITLCMAQFAELISKQGAAVDTHETLHH